MFQKRIRSGLSGIMAGVIFLFMLSGCAAGPAKTSETSSTAALSSTTTPEAVETTEVTTAQVSAEETGAAGTGVQVHIAALKGPTGMGLVRLMADQDEGKTANDYSFSLSGSPDDIVGQLTSGEADIAALPTNLAAVLYQKDNQLIRLLSINTLGVLYVLEKGDSIQTLADLSGKTLLATGQGSVPEYALDYLLNEAGIAGQVTVEFKAEHAELATLAASGQADLVLLPEPFVTTVLAKNSDFHIALDLTKEWQAVQKAKGEQGDLAMGCLVVSRTFAEENPEAVARFLTEYKNSTDYVNANPADAGQLVVKYGILADAALAAKAIPNCYITSISGPEMKNVLTPLYETLLAANPKSIGGQMPDDVFYTLP